MEDNKTLIKQQPQPELEADEFREEFKCCVCLDLLYKPVVLGCGHISCFWCVFNAMNAVRESYCAVCQHPYNHFPSICQLLHFLLQKLYPEAYKQREKQVGEEEKEFGYFSPQFDNPISESHPTEESNILDNVQSKNSESCSSGVGGSPSLVNSPETTLDDEAYIKRPTASLKNVEATGNAAIKEDCLVVLKMELTIRFLFLIYCVLHARTCYFNLLFSIVAMCIVNPVSTSQLMEFLGVRNVKACIQMDSLVFA